MLRAERWRFRVAKGEEIEVATCKNGGAKRAATGQTVLVEIEGGIAWVTLNRPEKRNAISPQLSAEMIAALDMLEGNADVGRAGAHRRRQFLLRRHGPQRVLPRHQHGALFGGHRVASAIT
ncbi:MAG TPA: enoyl-CoA hydratase-related protein [Stellaceae bacterium]